MVAEMVDSGDGFVGRYEVVETASGNRKWPDEVKARIVAQSFQPGVRVVDVARRYRIIPSQLSDWRRMAREGLLILAADSMAHIASDTFVPVAVDNDVANDRMMSVKGAMPENAPEAVVEIIIAGVMLRVPAGVCADRAASLVRALKATP